MKKMDAKAQIMKIVEKMPEYQASVILAYIQALQKTIEDDTRKMKAEAVFQYMQTVPEEDYELSDEEHQRIEQGRQQIREGRFHKWEDVAKELDM